MVEMSVFCGVILPEDRNLLLAAVKEDGRLLRLAPLTFPWKDMLGGDGALKRRCSPTNKKENLFQKRWGGSEISTEAFWWFFVKLKSSLRRTGSYDGKFANMWSTLLVLLLQRWFVLVRVVGWWCWWHSHEEPVWPIEAWAATKPISEINSGNK